MGRRRGLIDSNVLIATATSDHIHNDPSARLLEAAGEQEFATSIHCLSEFYNGTTRTRFNGGGALTPRQALLALTAMEGAMEVLALSIADQRNALTRFGTLGGIGPRIYDFLIGEVALIHGVDTIITWNTRHFVPLFPSLRILTPAQYLETL